MWIPRKPRGLQPHAWAITRILRGFLRMLVAFRLFNVLVINRDTVPQKGAVIIACNHISILDPVFLWGAVRRNAVAIAMATLWRIPGINILMWLLGQIPIKRGNAASGIQARTMGKRILEHNGLLFIYPEGRCSKTGELLPFKPGVADLAFETTTPVIPAGIVGSSGVKPLKSWKFRPRYPVLLQFGHALNPKDFTGPDAKEKFLIELSQRIAELSRSNT